MVRYFANTYRPNSIDYSVGESNSSMQSTNDYYPFGSPLPGRKFDGTSYKFGFNGKENDDEVYGDGCEYDYGFRIYDPRVGRFLSVDPLTSNYPWYTPYQFAGNMPIWAIDLDGLEELKVSKPTYFGITYIKIWYINDADKVNADPHGIHGVDYIDVNGNARRQETLNPRSLESVIYEQFCVDYYVREDGNWVKKNGPVKDAMGGVIPPAAGQQFNTLYRGFSAIVLKQAKVFFQSGKFEMNQTQNNPQATVREQFKNLNEIGRELQNNSDAKVIIMGFTDRDDTPGSNMTLPKDRAEAVQKYLMDNFNISADRFTINYEGEGQANPNQTVSDDRNVNITVIQPR